MSSAAVAQSRGPSAPQGAPVPTLRQLLEARLQEKRRFSLDEAIAIAVPLCLDLKTRHDKGEKVFVHPSCIAPGADGLARVASHLATAPSNAFTHTLTRDEPYYLTGPQQGRPPEGTFKKRTNVKLVESAGSYTRVTAGDGTTAWIAADALSPKR